MLFAELHRRMSSQGVWHNGWAILHLLLVLSDEHAASPAHSIVSSVCMCVRVYMHGWYVMVGIDKGSSENNLCGMLCSLLHTTIQLLDIFKGQNFHLMYFTG